MPTAPIADVVGMPTERGRAGPTDTGYAVCVSTSRTASTRRARWSARSPEGGTPPPPPERSSPSRWPADTGTVPARPSSPRGRSGCLRITRHDHRGREPPPAGRAPGTSWCKRRHASTEGGTVGVNPRSLARVPAALHHRPEPSSTHLGRARDPGRRLTAIVAVRRPPVLTIGVADARRVFAAAVGEADALRDHWLSGGGVPSSTIRSGRR